MNGNVVGTLEEMLSHRWLPDALERLADLHDVYGNPFAMVTDADIVRALALRVHEHQMEVPGA